MVQTILSPVKTFSFDKAPPIVVPPFGKVTLNARFTPSKTGKDRTVALILSDALILPLIAIPMSGKGVTPPIMTVTPSQLSALLSPGGSSTQTLSLANTGGAEYAFKVSCVSKPQEPSGAGLEGGAEIGDATLYVASLGTIRRLDPVTFQQIGDVIVIDSAGSWQSGLAFDGQKLFYIGDEQKILKFNPSDPSVVDTLAAVLPGYANGLGVTDQYVVAAYPRNGVYLFDKSSGELVNQWTVQVYNGITCATERNSVFLFNDMDGTIEERNLDDGALKNSFRAPTYAGGLGYSNEGHVLFVGGEKGDVFVLNPDDGTVIATAFLEYPIGAVAADEAVAPPKWLTSSIRSGVVMPGDKLDIGITFNAAELPAGGYYGEVKITPVVSGAPGPFVIPCNLTVSESESASK
jgi:hypothetical protein